MNRRENERCRSRCSISGTIAAFWVKLLAGSITPSPNPSLPLPTPPNPLVRRQGPCLSTRTPHPERPYQGKLDQRGAFCFAALCEGGKKSKLFPELEQFDML